MKRNGQRTAADYTGQLKQARDRLREVQSCMEKARRRIHLAEKRTELAETRTELAEIRAALAETRAEQAETTLQRLIQNGIDSAAQPLEIPRAKPSADLKGRLDQLTSRQCGILQYIAEGMNTKQIAQVLNLSPKTVEYHRLKLMRVLDVHDVAGLVRLAVRAGLVRAEA